ncbi:hypothetical protein NP493_54g03014 [Ridgeia piscesae]|uniref:ELMO domain-containing protein n=1 Tax=Ridgeia piscesae TaxID=27915 RepID=A0AAD9PAM8_RIDPI|nr:hypothetical protein NP493_54g03014 [Ridgeia piscesae]
MFFTHERPFEEFFCICILLLNKTWKEMKATSADFIKVFSVVKEQITRALERQPLTFDLFRHELQHLTYAEITRIWTQERRNKEDWESHSRPIVELREKIKPEIIELIKEQRLHYLVEGTQFTKYSQRGARMKDKFWYCRLSPNHKVFHYGDCEEASVPSIEQLQNKLAVVDIKGMYTGKDCPHIKDRGKKSSLSSLAFSIILEEEVGETVNFIAPSDVEFNLWTDGINALMGGVMTSDLMKQDLETLLTMEIKLRLLDTEGITIPETPPPIPAEPANYDFAYNM